MSDRLAAYVRELDVAVSLGPVVARPALVEQAALTSARAEVAAMVSSLNRHP